MMISREKIIEIRKAFWILLLLSAYCGMSSGCKKPYSGTIDNPDSDTDKIIDTTNINCIINIESNDIEGTISPLIMGFNTEYCRCGPDKLWLEGDGEIPRLLSSIGTHILRYPGGTMLTYTHWNHLTGDPRADIWDPNYDSSVDQPPSGYMDIDEYLETCKKLKLEPLLGINMASGMKYNRVNDGIKEAQKLVEYCKQNGLKAQYFYLGNEPYQSDANYTYTADQYAEMINKYVPAMKKIDPSIKIIANTIPIYERPSDADNLSRTRTLIKEAGKNIDFIDVHDYWAWGHADFDLWKSQENLEVSATGMTYREQRSFYKNLAASLGYPKIDMITLEWNIGKFGDDPPTQSEAALMIAEQFTQLIQSGMKMATFWTASWPHISYYELLLNADDNFQPNKVYSMFKLYKPVLGQSRIKNDVSDKAMEVLSVKSLNKDTLWIYMINKIPNQKLSKVRINTGNFSVDEYSSIEFDASDRTSGLWKGMPVETTEVSTKTLILKIPEYSLTRVTLMKE